MSGLSEADLKNPERSELLQDVMRSLAESLSIDPSLIAFDGVASSQRRQDSAPMKVKFKIYASAEKASTLAEEILSPKFFYRGTEDLSGCHECDSYSIICE